MYVYIYICIYLTGYAPCRQPPLEGRDLGSKFASQVVPKMVPRWFQFCDCKKTPTDPKTALRWPRKAPRDPQESPKIAPSGPKRPQDGPKMARSWPQDGPKMAPRWPQDGPKRPQDGPKMAPS